MEVESKFKKLGQLYKAVGLQTSAEAIGARDAALTAIFPKITVEQVLGLAGATFGVLSGTADLQWLVTAANAADASLGLTASDREVTVLATALLAAMIESGNELAILSTCTCSFGGLRKAEDDPDLEIRARQQVAEIQRRKPAALEKIKGFDKASLIEQLNQAKTLMSQNNAAGAAAPLIAAVTGVIDIAEQSHSRVARQIEGLGALYQVIAEETQLHWWVTGARSMDLAKPFKDFSIPALAVIIGKECADLTSKSVGPFSAPALLDIVLSNNRAQATVTLAEAAVGCPRSWRESWYGPPLSQALSPLCPISLAIEFATESLDAEDWQPRFQRVANLSPTTALPPLDLSYQLMQERLLLRMAR